MARRLKIQLVRCYSVRGAAHQLGIRSPARRQIIATSAAPMNTTGTIAKVHRSWRVVRECGARALSYRGCLLDRNTLAQAAVDAVVVHPADRGTTDVVRRFLLDVGIVRLRGAFEPMRLPTTLCQAFASSPRIVRLRTRRSSSLRSSVVRVCTKWRCRLQYSVALYKPLVPRYYWVCGSLLTGSVLSSARRDSCSRMVDIRH